MFEVEYYTLSQTMIHSFFYQNLAHIILHDLSKSQVYRTILRKVMNNFVKHYFALTKRVYMRLDTATTP